LLIEPSTTGLRVLLVGATGAVGQQVLQLALADPRCSQVIALTRRALPDHPKLENHIVDFADLPADAPWWQVDAVICTLGTTIKTAGSQTAFIAVDRDLPVLVAQLARQAGATRFALNSSLGASLNGNLYLRTKAQAETAIHALGYPDYTIVRPSLIDTARSESRPAELLGIWIARVFRLVIPKRYRAVRPEQIARALLEGALSTNGSERVIESEEL